MTSGVLYTRLVHSCSRSIRYLSVFSSLPKLILIMLCITHNIPALSQNAVAVQTASPTATPDLIDLEYRIKAAYLYNLSKFIQWPGEAANTKEAIDICLFGGNPFNDYIYKLEEREARGRPIKIINNPAADKLLSCEIVFVPINANKPGEFLATAQASNILTVGESDGFIDQGGLINLNLENGRVQLTINNTKAKNRGFIISANLLEIARQVD